MYIQWLLFKKECFRSWTAEGRSCWSLRREKHEKHHTEMCIPIRCSWFKMPTLRWKYSLCQSNRWTESSSAFQLCDLRRVPQTLLISKLGITGIPNLWRGLNNTCAAFKQCLAHSNCSKNSCYYELKVGPIFHIGVMFSFWYNLYTSKISFQKA